ncbi:hypothetical protein [Hubei tetragnatha maxillosa virus 5]|uniref:hypothetical protein n=1 Tax=Hubei tetragnatha maxillosa virus 5 TaxID=1923247 RepID=UPI00090BF192|nr:hypothetical protein [Hubei tetragnatha maxillosa virus 5]APG77455.1 hypothetical protein [Hubei tetragnatha maxillosa virus 5]
MKQKVQYSDEYGVHNVKPGFGYRRIQRPFKQATTTYRRLTKGTTTPKVTACDWSFLETDPLCIVAREEYGKFISAISNGESKKGDFSKKNNSNKNTNTNNNNTAQASQSGQIKDDVPDLKINVGDIDLESMTSSSSVSRASSVCDYPITSTLCSEIMEALPSICDPKATSVNEVEMVINNIFDKDIFPEMNDKAHLISIIVSTLTGLGTSVTTLFNTKMTKKMIALHVINITAQLTTFSITIATVFKKLKIKFLLSKVKDACKSLAETLLTKIRSNSENWLYTGISTLITIIIGGLSTFNIFNIKSIIDGGRWLTSLKSYQTAGKEALNFLCEDLLDLDIKGDKKTFEIIEKLAKRTSELKSYNYYDFVYDKSKLLELKELTNKVIGATMQRFKGVEVSRAAQAGLRIIIENHNELISTLKKVNSIIESSKRQECVGLLLAGPPNTGKSHMTTFIANKVAKILGYSPDIYNVDKSCKGTYFQPYGLQDIGVQEEFMAMRSQDESLGYINKIVSSDPFSLEGADLDFKIQPCQLKLLMLTANAISPNLTGVLDESYARAVWDRIMRVEVSDPLAEGRHTVSAHRKPDYSHVTLRLVTNTRELKSCNLKYETITINQLINILINRIINKEVNYIDTLLNPDNLQQLPDENKNKLIQRKSHLQHINSLMVKSNAGEYKVIRIQGPPQTGKSMFAKQIANLFTSTYPSYKIINIDKEALQAKIDPGHFIYIIDDILEHTVTSYNQYIEWINKIDSRSIVIIVSNYIFPKFEKNMDYSTRLYGWWTGIPNQPISYYKFNLEGIHDGIVRRLGLPGMVELHGQFFTTSKTSQLLINVKNYGTTWDFQGATMNQCDILNSVHRTMSHELQNIMDVKIHEGMCGNINAKLSADVQFKNVAIGAKTFSSIQNLLRALIIPEEGVKITIEPNFIQAIQATYDQATQLLGSTEISTKEQRRVAMYQFAILMNRVRRGVYLRLKLIDEDETYVLHDGILYVPPLTNHNIQFQHNKEHISFFYNGENHNYSISLLKELNEGTQPIALTHLDPLVLAKLNQYYQTHIKDHDTALASWYAFIEEEKVKLREGGILGFLKHHWVVSLITGIGLIWTFKKIFTTIFTPGAGNASTVLDEDEDIQHLAARYRKAIFQPDSAREIVAIRDQARREGVYEKFNDFEYSIRSNAHPNLPIDKQYEEDLKAVKLIIEQTIRNKDVDQLIEYMKQFPRICAAYLQERQGLGNMLTVKETSHQTPKPVQLLCSKLKSNYVRVDSSRGIVYGLVYNNTVITVSHMVEEGDYVTIRSNGKAYKGQVFKVVRREDRAFIRILDKTFPPSASIKSLFTDINSLQNLREAWFIKPTESPIFCRGDIKYINHTAIPIKDINNPLYDLNRKYIEFSLISMKGVMEVFALGDCGLPLVAKINNEFKIIGIHNGLSASNVTWFTSITKEDLEINPYSNSAPVEYTSTLDIVLNPLTNKNNQLDKETVKALLSPSTTSHFNVSNKIKFFGFYPQFKSPSNYKHKKVYNPLPEEFLECLTAPAPLYPSDVKDTSKLTKDARGIYDPLFAQVLKYGERTANYRKWDTKIVDWTLHLIKLYYSRHYQDFKFRLLKPHEIINKWNNLKAMDMSTSAGPRLKRMGILTKRPAHDPDILFVDANKHRLNEPPFYHFAQTKAATLLKNDYNYYLQSIQEGIPILMMCQDCRKVEIIDKEKAKYKLRLFNAVDLSVNMVLKSYFGIHLNNVIEKKDECIYTIGMNPYTDASTHMKYFNRFEGTYQNADFSALDKSIPPELIKWFVECVFQKRIPQKEQDALYETLTFCIHNMEGHLYGVHGGNESGSYVTTLLNVFVVHFTTWYTTIKKFFSINKEYPSIEQIEEILTLRIMGDDCIRKYRKGFEVTFEELKEDASLFNLNQTEAKGEGEISFCSRTYIKIKDDIYAPVLKKCSIISCLFWLANETPEQIKQNCQVALLEAALYTHMEKEEGMKEGFLFDKVQLTVEKYARKYSFDPDIFPYEMYIDGFVNYVRMYSQSPFFKDKGETQKSIKITANSYELDIFQYILHNSAKSNMAAEYDVQFNEYLQLKDIRSHTITYTVTQYNERPGWSCHLSVTLDDTVEGCGSGTTKKEAKKEACADFFTNLENLKPKLRKIFKTTNPFLNGQSNNSPHSIDSQDYAIFSDRNSKFSPERRRDILEKMREEMKFACLEQFKDDDYTGDVRANFKIIKAGKKKVKYQFEFSKIGHANTGDQAIEPATMMQAAQGQSTMNLPAGVNPQPTQVTPAMTQPGEAVMANIQLAQTDTLNPVGAPNMLAVGAITFDIKSLIYEQYLDSDIEYEVTDDVESGSIIAQIPYAVNSSFVNRYILAYSRLHERYAGAIMFRITVIGNPTFSGAIGMAWYPRAIQEPIARISELQKYAYSAEGVTLPFNKIHILHDGRQELFYRSTNETVDGNRPHLILFVMLSIQSALREGIRTRMRIASKLANGADPNPFHFANPELELPFPDSPTPPGTTTSSVSQFGTVFPQINNKRMFLYTDGVYASPEHFDDEIPVFSTIVRNLNLHAGVGEQGAPMPSLGVAQEWDDLNFGGEWPGYSIPTSGASRTGASLAFTSTLNSRNTALLLRALPSPVSDGTRQVTLANWRMFSFYTQYDTPFLATHGIQIHSVTGSDTTYALPSNFSGRHHQASGWRKIITDKGVMIVHLILHAFTSGVQVGQNMIMEFEPSGVYPTPQDPNRTPNYPYLLIEEQFMFARPSAVALPPGYKRLVFSNMEPSAVVIPGFNYATASNEPVLKKWFQERAINLPSTQALQFRLIDRISTRAIATVRYLQELDTFVINSNDPISYRALRTNIENIDITTPVAINRTLDFAYSDTMDWESRTGQAFLATLGYQSSAQEEAIGEVRGRHNVGVVFRPFIEEAQSNMLKHTEPKQLKVWEFSAHGRKQYVVLHPHLKPIVKSTTIKMEESDKTFTEYCNPEEPFRPLFVQGRSNAMLAAMIGGGALSGIGGALQQNAQNKFHEKMQGNQFSHEASLQGNMFAHQKTLQDSNFDFQKYMQQGNFGQEQLIQERGYQNDLGLLQSSHLEQRETNRQESQNRMTERGLSARVMNLPGLNGGSSRA